MSEAERLHLIPLARKVRGSARREALQVVVEPAIEQAVEATKTGPVTDDDLLIAKAVLDAQGK